MVYLHGSAIYRDGLTHVGIEHAIYMQTAGMPYTAFGYQLGGYFVWFVFVCCPW